MTLSVFNLFNLQEILESAAAGKLANKVSTPDVKGKQKNKVRWFFVLRR